MLRLNFVKTEEGWLRTQVQSDSDSNFREEVVKSDDAKALDNNIAEVTELLETLLRAKAATEQE